MSRIYDQIHNKLHDKPYVIDEDLGSVDSEPDELSIPLELIEGALYREENGELIKNYAVTDLQIDDKSVQRIEDKQAAGGTMSIYLRVDDTRISNSPWMR